jgi:hypothetical protein
MSGENNGGGEGRPWQDSYGCPGGNFNNINSIPTTREAILTPITIGITILEIWRVENNQ